MTVIFICRDEAAKADAIKILFGFARKSLHSHFYIVLVVHKTKEKFDAICFRYFIKSTATIETA